MNGCIAQLQWWWRWWSTGWRKEGVSERGSTESREPRWCRPPESNVAEEHKNRRGCARVCVCVRVCLRVAKSRRETRLVGAQKEEKRKEKKKDRGG